MKSIAQSIRLQVFVILLIGIATMILAFSIGIFGKNQIINNYQRLITQDVSKIERIAAVNVSFKTQVQEWKNTLLRGHDQEQRDKYWQRFEKHAINISKELDGLLEIENSSALSTLLTEFKSVYPDMMERYRQGYETFVSSEFNHKLADKSVSGIDRRPTQILIEAVEIVREETRNKGQVLLEDSKQYSLINGVLISISALFTCWFLLKMLTKRVINPIKNINELSTFLAKGDFTKPVDSERVDEIGELMHNVEAIRTDLGKLINEILTNMEQLGIFIEDTFIELEGISNDIDETHKRTTSLKSFIEQIESNSLDLSASGRERQGYLSENTESMKSQIDGFVSSKALAGQVNDSMQDSIMRMQQLKQESDSISSLLNTIQQIAEQTNLLALNAAIEAARAGESGRGFAVVADEVRQLAQKTQSTASQIGSTINKLNQDTESAFDSIESSIDVTSKTTTKFEQMVTFMQSTTTMLSDLTNQQAQVSEEIEIQVVSSNSVAQEMDKAVIASNKSKAASEEIKTKTRLVQGIILDIKSVASRFTTNEKTQ